MIYEVKTDALAKAAASVAEVLAKHKVFGVAAEDASPEEKADLLRWVEHEKLHFVGMALRHAEDPHAFLPQTLKYEDTGAWVKFNTRIAFSNTALLSFVEAVPVLSPNPTLAVNPHIDYEALNAELKATVTPEN
jgi:hypothetical protein